MATDNRSRALSGDEKNSPEDGCVNAFSISDYVDVDYVFRPKGLSGTEKASPGGSSGTAYAWLLQSGLVAFVPGLSGARHFAVSPLGAARLCDPSAPGAGVQIKGSDAPSKLFQSLPGAVLQVRRMQPVRPPFRGNQSADLHALEQSIKTAECSGKNGQKLSLWLC